LRFAGEPVAGGDFDGLVGFAIGGAGRSIGSKYRVSASRMAALYEILAAEILVA
jgi:hypothetical protein